MRWRGLLSPTSPMGYHRQPHDARLDDALSDVSPGDAGGRGTARDGVTSERSHPRSRAHAANVAEPDPGVRGRDPEEVTFPLPHTRQHTILARPCPRRARSGAPGSASRHLARVRPAYARTHPDWSTRS